MSIEEIEDVWKTQADPRPGTGNDELCRRIERRSRKMARSERRLTFFFAALAILCWTWFASWAVVFMGVGVTALRAEDLYPPLGVAFVTPAYIGTVCGAAVWSYLAQRRRARQASYADALRRYVAESRIQLERRIKLLRYAPPAFLVCVAIASVTLYLTPEFNYLQRVPPGWAFAAFLPDLTLLGGLIWWSRRSIRRRHQPRLVELKSLQLHLDQG